MEILDDIRELESGVLDFFNSYEHRLVVASQDDLDQPVLKRYHHLLLVPGLRMVNLHSLLSRSRQPERRGVLYPEGGILSNKNTTIYEPRSSSFQNLEDEFLELLFTRN